MFNLVKLIDAVDKLLALNEQARETEVLEHQCSAHRAVLDVWCEAVRLTGCPILYEQLVRYQVLPHIQANVPTLYRILR